MFHCIDTFPGDQHDIIAEQLRQMEQELGWVRSEVGRQQEYAKAAFADQDHINYCQEQLQVLACCMMGDMLCQTYACLCNLGMLLSLYNKECMGRWFAPGAALGEGLT